MISPTNTDDRRDSFGNDTSPVFSPQSNIWTDFSNNTMAERPFNVMANLPEHSNNPFIRSDSGPFAQHNSPWTPMFEHSESRTPIMPATYDYQGDFEAAPTPAFPHVASASPAFGNMAAGIIRPSSVFPSAPTPASLPTSPPPGKDWMTLAEQGGLDSRPIPKRMRQSSPPRPYSPFPRRDGIRKKNARFDIPPERSLANIDQLILNSNDDTEIKELKQQKRLLRNRQAALDSRQRKKQRAEELEHENKKWTDRITMMEEEMQKMALSIDGHVQEKEHLMRERVQIEQQMQEMTWEKENMVQEHTLETGELRKKITILTERLDEVANAPPHSGSTHYNDFADEMNGLNMESNDWDFLNFDMDSGVADQKPQETSLVLAPKKKDGLPEDEKPIASGFLMLLLLCGAWVATKSTSTTAPNVPLPHLSDEVRATSAIVLNNLMKDAGLPGAQPSSIIAGLEPAVSGTPQSRQVNMGNSGYSVVPVQNSDRLGAISHKLISHTKDQEAEQAFSLSVAQYDRLTSTDLPRREYSTSPSDEDLMTPPNSHSSRRRGLADTLKAMRDDAKGESAANVYTRSLLWDRIPTEIMQEFQRMVEESNTAVGDAGGGE
ncbi:hypothetical protein EJ08DRAFT_669110 [Tothia fuscella]|uniref:BZIP domain-containing protein n=1 Tax=Tothia fuscella TaxID=1048955 RepID=A0A9P4U0K0_9PEZI|nr:hypothetical protein EJ08DRAFT_669110 [Tothia fuscella]